MEMAGNDWKWLQITGMAGNGWTWLEMTVNCWNGWKWLKIGLKMVRKICQSGLTELD